MLERLITYDNTRADWKQFLGGTTWDEFVEPIVSAYREFDATVGIGNYDRNDILRPAFNALCVREDGGIDAESVEKFYSDPLGTYVRNRVYEMGSEGSFRGLVNHGDSMFTCHLEYATAYCLARHRFGDGFRALDHGCGNGYTGVGLAALGADVVLHDYNTPSLRMAHWLSLENNLRVKLTDPRDEFSGFGKHGRYHLVITQDVLEHVIDPVAELARLYVTMEDRGILLMGTFFDSCGGRDPQHLEAHAKYQDVPTWFAEVERLGFNLIGRDANGVEKLWEKT